MPGLRAPTQANGGLAWATCPQVFDELTGGTVTRTYTYGLQRISENQIVNSAWTPSFYGYDGSGTVRQLTNTAGAVTDTYEYDAFGNEITHTGTTPNNYLYRGEQYDPDLGLYFLRARYYNPLTGRFMSRDPEDGKIKVPATLHKYLYADGNPVNWTDPTGREKYVNPNLNSPVGNAIQEYLGLIQTIKQRAFLLTQVVIPVFLKTEQGAAVKLLVASAGATALAFSCELLATAEELRNDFDNVNDPVVDCNSQQDTSPGGPGDGPGHPILP